MPPNSGGPVFVDERMLPAGARVTREYLLLSLIAFGGILLFWAIWLGSPGIGDDPAQYLVLTLIIIYYLGVWCARWVALRRMARPSPVEPEPGLRVAVATSFVPAAEPLSMLEVTIRALVNLDYPHDTWVLDEGNDPETRALCERLGARHFSRRDDPRYKGASGPFALGTKYGNYNAWLHERVYGHYDFVATFDPDHVPQPHYLTTLLGYFRDPCVGYAQAPPVHYNQAASFIARGAAEEGYAYYSSHQMASYALGHPIIVGSHSVHRAAALQAAGGFPAHDAEDLYLTMLYRALGWRGVYVPQILALGTTPVDWSGYLRQQVRWARAVMDLKLRALPALAKRLSPIERLLNLFHGVYYLRPLAMFVLLAMLLEMLVENRVPDFLRGLELLAGGGLLVLLGVVDRFRQRFYLDPERERGLHWRAAVLQVAKWPHLVSALLDVGFGRKFRYTTTPKRESVIPGRVLAPAHLLIGLLVALAAAIGALRTGGLDPLLKLLAGLAIAMALWLAWSETWRPPPPYDPDLLRRRQAELGWAESASSPITRDL